MGRCVLRRSTAHVGRDFHAAAGGAGARRWNCRKRPMRRRDFADVRSKGRLTNRFFPKDRCTLPNQMSFLPAHSCSAFVLAKGDRHGANKNEIAIFVFSVTTKGFSLTRAPGWKRGRSSSRRKLGQRAGRRQSGFPNAAISKASFARAGPNSLQVLK